MMSQQSDNADNKPVNKQANRTQAEVKADKRAAALRDNLKKRKALAKETKANQKSK